MKEEINNLRNADAMTSPQLPDEFEKEGEFIKILRKDKINMNRFVLISDEARFVLDSTKDSDVLALTIDVTDTMRMRLSSVEKVMPESFDKLVLMKRKETKMPNELTDLKEHLAAVQHEIWSHWMKYQFSKCGKFGLGSLIIPKELVEQWTRQMNTPYEKLTEKEKASDREQVDKFWGLIESGFLYRPSSLHDVYKNTCKLVEDNKKHGLTPLDLIQANQIVIKAWGAKVVEMEKEIKERKKFTDDISDQTVEFVLEFQKHEDSLPHSQQARSKHL